MSSYTLPHKPPKNLLYRNHAGDLWLNVPFNDNDQVVDLGAWFDRDAKLWFIPFQIIRDWSNPTPWWHAFSPWLLTKDIYPKNKNYYLEYRDYLGIWLKVPPRDKHKARELGAKYDREAEQWYIPLRRLNKWKKFRSWLETTPEADDDDWFVYYDRC